MNSEWLVCIISYWSLSLGCLFAIATIIVLPIMSLEPALPRQTITVLFASAIILLGIGFHCLDRLADIRRGKSL